jgi:hypothetical protein
MLTQLNVKYGKIGIIWYPLSQRHLLNFWFGNGKLVDRQRNEMYIFSSVLPRWEKIGVGG